jgi:hypothetical protein
VQSPDDHDHDECGPAAAALVHIANVPPERVARLPHPDIRQLAALLALSRSWALGEYTLVAELPPAPPRYRPVSMVLATASMLGLLTIAAIICSGIWRFFS